MSLFLFPDSRARDLTVPPWRRWALNSVHDHPLGVVSIIITGRGYYYTPVLVSSTAPNLTESPQTQRSRDDLGPLQAWKTTRHGRQKCLRHNVTPLHRKQRAPGPRGEALLSFWLRISIRGCHSALTGPPLHSCQITAHVRRTTPRRSSSRTCQARRLGRTRRSMRSRARGA